MPVLTRARKKIGNNEEIKSFPKNKEDIKMSKHGETKTETEKDPSKTKQDEPPNSADIGLDGIEDHEQVRHNLENLTLNESKEEINTKGDIITRFAKGDINIRFAIQDITDEYIRDTVSGENPKFIQLTDTLIAMKNFQVFPSKNDLTKHYSNYVIIKSTTVDDEEKFKCNCLKVKNQFESVVQDEDDIECHHLVVASIAIPHCREAGKILQARSNADKNTFLVFTLRRALWIYVKWDKPTDTPHVAIMTKTNSGTINCFNCSVTDCSDHAAEVYSCCILEPPRPKSVNMTEPTSELADEPKPDFAREHIRNKLQAVTRKPIIFPYPAHLQSYHAELRSGRYSQLKDLVPQYDPNLKCIHGYQFSPEDPVEKKWITRKYANLVTVGKRYMVTVYYRKATNCMLNCQQHYDGGEHFILNLNNLWLFTHSELLQLPFDQQSHQATSHGRSSTNNITEQMCGNAFDKNDVDSKRELDAYNCFIRLIDPKSWKIGFECVDCLRSTRWILLADGLQMGSSKLHQDIFGETEYDNIIEDKKMYRGTLSQERNFISRDAKKLMAQWVEAIENSESLSVLKNAKEALHNYLLRDESDRKVVGMYFQFLDPKPSKVVLNFMKEMSLPGANIPGCFQTRGQTDKCRKIRQACTGEFSLLNNDGVQRDLGMFSPILQVIQEEQFNNQKRDGSISVSIELRDMVNFVLDVINMPPIDPVPDVAPEKPVIRKLQTFPTRPIVRKMVTFHQDQKNRNSWDNKNKKKCRSRISPNDLKETEKLEFQEDDISCANEHNTTQKTTPGLFVISCIHKVIWGITYLTETESVKHAFQILSERFTKDDLKRITFIFDNSCKFHAYIQNRDPDHFAGMVLISDAFHSRKGHSTCPSSFKREYWEQMLNISRDDANQRFNTAAAEQLNALLRNAEKMVRCASISNAKLYVDMLIFVHNLLTLELYTLDQAQ